MEDEPAQVTTVPKVLEISTSAVAKDTAAMASIPCFAAKFVKQEVAEPAKDLVVISSPLQRRVLICISTKSQKAAEAGDRR